MDLNRLPQARELTRCSVVDSWPCPHHTELNMYGNYFSIRYRYFTIQYILYIIIIECSVCWFEICTDQVTLCTSFITVEKECFETPLLVAAQLQPILVFRTHFSLFETQRASWNPQCGCLSHGCSSLKKYNFDQLQWVFWNTVFG